MKQTEINLNSGDIVLLDFPGAQKTKTRPALILSSRVYHRERPDVILGLITTQTTSASSSTDYRLQDWAQANLRRPSAFRSFLVTLPRTAVKLKVGKLSNRDWSVVAEKIQRALGLKQGH